MYVVQIEAQQFFPAAQLKITSGTKGVTLGVTEHHRRGNYDIPLALTPAQAREIAAELVYHADEVEGGL